MPDTAVTGAAGAAAHAATNVADENAWAALSIILLVICGLLIWQLGKAQNARVEDAKKVATDALAREDKWQGVLNELSTAVERLVDRVMNTK